MQMLLCVVAGYIFGLFQTGYIYGRMNHIDIRKYGSGNSGTTNALRVLGKKAGAIVFAGDFLKTLIPCIFTRILFSSEPEAVYLLMLCTGFGVILGHNFPFYLDFKGGKGIAATAGVIVAVDLRLTAICLVAFLLAVIITRYVSLGSIIVLVIFCLYMFYASVSGLYMIGDTYRISFYIVTVLITLMGLWRHRANMGRLLHGKENKLW